MATRAGVERRVACCEVVGPPGAGKTTLLRALGQTGDGIRATTGHRSVGRIDIFARCWASLTPLVLGERRRYSRLERLWMLRLEAGSRIAQRESTTGCSAIIFDQGPVYTMVRLQEATPLDRRSPAFLQWWDRTAEFWGRSMDLVIMLDAPDQVLVERVRERSKTHAIKALSGVEARRAIAQERSLYDDTIRRLAADGHAQLARFDSTRDSVGQIVAAVSKRLGV